MNTNEIQLSRKITNQLLHTAQMSPEQEVCGLIGAKDGIAHTCYAINNTAEQPEIRFQLDEKQQISAMSAIRDKNETLFAIYHSHPSAPAVPSATDIKLASYPDAVHLIISLSTKGILEIRAFSIIKQTVKEFPISMSST
jgi:proteasome lid subunit RPN8/RPN11